MCARPRADSWWSDPRTVSSEIQAAGNCLTGSFPAHQYRWSAPHGVALAGNAVVTANPLTAAATINTFEMSLRIRTPLVGCAVAGTTVPTTVLDLSSRRPFPTSTSLCSAHDGGT